MFMKASRLKLRFESINGMLSVEDLWDLPLTSNNKRANLDDIARKLYSQLKSGEDVSFVVKDRKSDTRTQLAFDVVKYIIDVRLAENEAQAIAKSNADKKQRILEIISQREDDSLKTLSVEELKKLAAELA